MDIQVKKNLLDIKDELSILHDKICDIHNLFKKSGEPFSDVSLYSTREYISNACQGIDNIIKFNSFGRNINNDLENLYLSDSKKLIINEEIAKEWLLRAIMAEKQLKVFEDEYES